MEITLKKVRMMSKFTLILIDNRTLIDKQTINRIR